MFRTASGIFYVQVQHSKDECVCVCARYRTAFMYVDECLPRGLLNIQRPLISSKAK